MFTVDQTQFKKAVHTLIDAIKEDERPPHPEAFVGQVVQLARKHHVVISANEFGLQIYKLIVARNSQRAHKLVDALDDTGVSLAGAMVRVSLKVAFKYGTLALFIIFVVWAYKHCGG